jgi:DNA-binding CsgD family transcriptional regulator
MPTGPGSLLLDVADAAADLDTVVSTVTDSVRAWVGAGPVFVATADPLTGAFSATFTFDIPAEAAAKFYEIELSGLDVCRFEELARSETGMAALYSATGDHPEASRRWREVLVPLHWGDELRVAVRGRGRTWGYLCLHREAHERAFTGRDAGRLAALVPALATALRSAARIAPGDSGRPETGVVLADLDGNVVASTGAAEEWLAQLGPARRGGLPLLLEGVCRCVAHDARPASASIATRTGRTALVEVSALHAAEGAQLAIVIRSAPATHTLERFVVGANLTPRETEVVGCVLRGVSTRAIADVLGVAPDTVQAHLTSVFGKTGFCSRRELVSRLRG